MANFLINPNAGGYRRECSRCGRLPWLCRVEEGFCFFCPMCDVRHGDLETLDTFHRTKTDAARLWGLRQLAFDVHHHHEDAICTSQEAVVN